MHTNNTVHCFHCQTLLQLQPGTGGVYCPLCHAYTHAAPPPPSNHHMAPDYFSLPYNTPPSHHLPPSQYNCNHATPPYHLSTSPYNHIHLPPPSHYPSPSQYNLNHAPPSHYPPPYSHIHAPPSHYPSPSPYKPRAALPPAEPVRSEKGCDRWHLVPELTARDQGMQLLCGVHAFPSHQEVQFSRLFHLHAHRYVPRLFLFYFVCGHCLLMCLVCF
ncbi:Zinc finger, LSD1-type [Sesbania bispinosa]|nr:Zinc finger, LSD1-type [Sesbania bispinosa]